MLVSIGCMSVCFQHFSLSLCPFPFVILCPSLSLHLSLPLYLLLCLFLSKYFYFTFASVCSFLSAGFSACLSPSLSPCPSFPLSGTPVISTEPNHRKSPQPHLPPTPSTNTQSMIGMVCPRGMTTTMCQLDIIWR